MDAISTVRTSSVETLPGEPAAECTASTEVTSVQCSHGSLPTTTTAAAPRATLQSGELAERFLGRGTSAPLRQHSIENTREPTLRQQVANAFIQLLMKKKSCTVQDFYEHPEWQMAKACGLRALRKFFKDHQHIFELGPKGRVWLNPAYNTASINKSTSRTTSEDLSPRASPAEAVVRLSLLKVAPKVGTTLWVNPADLRWTHERIQSLFTCGRSVEDVAMQLKQGALLPSDIPMLQVVRYQGKWYSRNNRRLWCFKEARVKAVMVVVSSVDFHFLKGLSTQNQGVSVGFFPPALCEACGKEFLNRETLRSHVCSPSSMRGEAEEEGGAEPNTVSVLPRVEHAHTVQRAEQVSGLSTWEKSHSDNMSEGLAHRDFEISKDWRVLNGLRQVVSTAQGEACDLEELAKTNVWKTMGLGIRELKGFLKFHRDVFTLTQSGSRCGVTVSSCAPPASRMAAAPSAETRYRVAKPWSVLRRCVVEAFVQFVSSRIKKNKGCHVTMPCYVEELHALPEWQRAKKRLGKLRVFLKENSHTFELRSKDRVSLRRGVPTRSSARLTSAKPSPCARPPVVVIADSRKVVGVVRLSALKVPRSTLWVDSGELRRAHGRVPRLCTGGRPALSVKTKLLQGLFRPSDMRMISVVRYQGQWYSRNNRRLWGFKHGPISSSFKNVHRRCARQADKLFKAIRRVRAAKSMARPTSAQPAITLTPTRSVVEALVRLITSRMQKKAPCFLRHLCGVGGWKKGKIRECLRDHRDIFEIDRSGHVALSPGYNTALDALCPIPGHAAAAPKLGRHARRRVRTVGGHSSADHSRGAPGQHSAKVHPHVSRG